MIDSGRGMTVEVIMVSRSWKIVYLNFVKLFREVAQSNDAFDSNLSILLMSVAIGIVENTMIQNCKTNTT